MSDSLQPHGLKPSRLLCPWDSPGKSTGVGCHFLLQGIFPTQGLDAGLLRCRQITAGKPGLLDMHVITCHSPHQACSLYTQPTPLVVFIIQCLSASESISLATQTSQTQARTGGVPVEDPGWEVSAHDSSQDPVSSTLQLAKTASSFMEPSCHSSLQPIRSLPLPSTLAC